MTDSKVSSYVAIDPMLDEESIPPEYIKALKPYLSSIPEPLYAPWPIVFNPAVGDEVTFYNLLDPWGDLGVTKVEYDLSSSDGYRRFIHCEPLAEHVPNSKLADLLHFSEVGFCILMREGMVSLKKIFEKAGLKAVPDK